MTATYWIAKHIEDVFRNEPRNVGVVVRVNELYAARFVGERDSGEIDRRKIAKSFLYPAVYIQWRDFWRRKIQSKDMRSIVQATTPNYFVYEAGEVSDIGVDNAADVCHFLYEMLVGKGLIEALEWNDVDPDGVNLVNDIISALLDNSILATSDQLFARYPIVRDQNIKGSHAIHKPSFSQRNDRLAVMEYIDLSSKKINKTKERAGWMAYMFADIKYSENNMEAFSLVRSCDSHCVEQIEYAKSILEGESRVVNWADAASRNRFLEERKRIAEPNLSIL